MAKRSKKYSDEQCLSALLFVAQKLGRSPTRDEFNNYYSEDACPEVMMSEGLLRHRFGKDKDKWNGVLQWANLKPFPEVNLLNMAKCLIEAAGELGRAPNTPEYNALYADGGNDIFISHQTIIGTLGTWRLALRFAGLEPSAVCRKSRTIRARDDSSASARRKGIERLAKERLALSEPTFTNEHLLLILLNLHQVEERLEELGAEGLLPELDGRLEEIERLLFSSKQIAAKAAR